MIKYICPKCGTKLSPLEEIFIDNESNVVGCDYCIERADAEDVLAPHDEEGDEI